MRISIFGGIALNLAFLFTAHALLAHHGNSMYDHSRLVTLKGTIAAFQFINPHARILLDVKDSEGEIERWKIELGSSTSMRRRGWRSDKVKTGDKVTILGYRAKDGSLDLHMQKLLLADGTDLGG